MLLVIKAEEDHLVYDIDDPHTPKASFVINWATSAARADSDAFYHKGKAISDVWIFEDSSDALGKSMVNATRPGLSRDRLSFIMLSAKVVYVK